MSEFFVCDDLVSDIEENISRKKLEELLSARPETKMMSGSFGRFKAKDFQNQIKELKETVWKSMYFQEPISPRTRPYRNKENGKVYYLELNVSKSTSGFTVKTPKNHKLYFKKYYREYRDFLDEWEEIKE